MSDDYFGIEGYEPAWQCGVRAVSATHGVRLASLVGRTLTRAALLWDVEDDEWFADAPVVLDFEGEQVELQHQKFDDLSLTWGSVDPGRPVRFLDFALRWRDDAVAELAALQGQPLCEVELLEWRGQDAAYEMVAVGFRFPQGRVTVQNGLDENDLSFAPPEPEYRRHALG
ncbi:hypothetical protein [Streptomyces sp. NBC_01304]|uniref:hypothetical protein n=1 Tax=Streptomyces sp. NBC_01304 TaxID=2903818 RepID=UPI002E1658FF|nr:hypothetical protein OG430_34755 [Streptomyces sp. NBC_01304]